MKIIEGMKELRLIEKKIRSNTQNIEQYSSGLSTEREVFGSEKDQKAQVSAFVQSNIDLIENYAKIKSQLEKTNLETIVHIDGMQLSISEWLTYRRKLGSEVMITFRSLNTNAADSRLRMAGKITEKDGQPKVIRYYDETEKNEHLSEWMSRLHNIDSTLEVINATTDMVK